MVTFTYSELGIASFLYPALYQGLFNRVYWLRRRHDEGSESEIVCVTSDNGEGKRLRSSPALSLEAALDSDRRCFRLFRVTTDDAIDVSDRSIVLDIDLDYFSCDNRSGEGWEIEITRSAYDAFRADRYHALRLAAGNLVKVREREGSYYLCSNYAALAETNLEVDEALILSRIDALAAFLERNAIRPAIIDVARSRFSGYTPGHQWRFIESKLIERLASLYEFNMLPLASAIPGRKKS
jgi:hypothetical protein